MALGVGWEVGGIWWVVNAGRIVCSCELLPQRPPR